MAGRKPISINLKSTAPDGEIRFFETIREADKELGFSERGIGKAYHAGRNRIGEYDLEWLEPDELPGAMLGAISRKVPRTDAAKIKAKIEDRHKKLMKIFSIVLIVDNL